MTSVEYLLRDLLEHLGVTHVLHTHQGPYGKTVREHHLFADDRVITQVLRYVVQRKEIDPVRVFHGDPPPF